MQVGPAGLLILLVVLAGLGAAAAFGWVALARAMARSRPPQHQPTVVPVRPAVPRSHPHATR
jgi:hypothetical protein